MQQNTTHLKSDKVAPQTTCNNKLFHLFKLNRLYKNMREQWYFVLVDCCLGELRDQVKLSSFVVSFCKQLKKKLLLTFDNIKSCRVKFWPFAQLWQSISSFCVNPSVLNCCYCCFSGMFFVLPCIDSYQKVDLRVVSFDVPPQEVPVV